MDYLKRQFITVFALFTFILVSIAVCQDQTAYTASELIESIKISEGKIHDIQAHIVWWEPDVDNMLVVYDWGYDSGKEFIEGYKWSGEDRDKPTAKIKYAFDGEAQRNFRYNTGENFTTGGIYGFTPDTFTVYMTPKALLGYSMKQHAQESFGEILSRAERIKVREKTERIDGHSCCVLEAVGIQDGDCLYDIRVWIDSQRDFRPLKIEKFYSPEDGYHSNLYERWLALCIRVDNIKLKQLNAIWFPVQGDRQFFSQKILPPEGMTDEEFKKAFSHLSVEEQVKKAKYIVIPRGQNRRIKVSDIKINEGIDSEEFTIKFPQGCRVWDDFKQLGYTVGVNQKVGLSELSTENIESVITLERPEDINKSVETPPVINRVSIDANTEHENQLDEETESEIVSNFNWRYGIIFLLIVSTTTVAYIVIKRLS